MLLNYFPNVHQIKYLSIAKGLYFLKYFLVHGNKFRKLCQAPILQLLKKSICSFNNFCNSYFSFIVSLAEIIQAKFSWKQLHQKKGLFVCKKTHEMIICNTWFYYFEQYLLLYFYYKYNFIRIFILKTIKNMLNYRYIQFMKFERKIEVKQDLRTALGGGAIAF